MTSPVCSYSPRSECAVSEANRPGCQQDKLQEQRYVAGCPPRLVDIPRRDWLAGLFAFGVFILISAGMAVAKTAGASAATAGSAQSGDMPDNAVIIGNGWRCRDRFAIGDSGKCELIRALLNAIVTGNEWVCMPGFRQDGEACKRLMPPANSVVRGSDWTCNPGFRWDGDACTVIIAPANANVRGDDYHCNAGFTEDDNGLCLAVVAPANATIRGDGSTYNPGYARTESDSCRRIN